MGGPRCVTYFRGVPGCVTKCDRGRGSKLAKYSVTYFMDGYKPTTIISITIDSRATAATFFGTFVVTVGVII